MPTFAAVDIGSNSVRLKIARSTARGLVAVHEDREVTRLGESVFHSGFLSPDAIANTVKVLRRFHRAVQEAGADAIRVVGTSALRDARNSRAFYEWVRSATGWTVEIISGIEEARLIHLGLVSAMRMGSSPMLMIDLGGGSCELTLSVKGHIRNTVSLPIGAVRLTSEFLHHDPARKPEMRQLLGFVSREINRTADRILRAKPTALSPPQARLNRWLRSATASIRRKVRAPPWSPEPRCDVSPKCWPACPWKSAPSSPASGPAAPKSLSPAQPFMRN